MATTNCYRKWWQDFHFWVRCPFNNQSVKSPLVQSSICDVTSEVCCCDVTMTSFSSLVMWQTRLRWLVQNSLYPARVSMMNDGRNETEWRVNCHVRLKYSFNLWSEDCKDVIFSSLRFMEQGWWNLRNTLLICQRCHVDVWHGQKQRLFAWLTAALLNRKQHTVHVYITYLDDHVWPAALWLGPVKTSVLAGLILSPAQGPENTHKQSPCICPLINHTHPLLLTSAVCLFRVTRHAWPKTISCGQA